MKILADDKNLQIRTHMFTAAAKSLPDVTNDIEIDEKLHSCEGSLT